MNGEIEAGYFAVMQPLSCSEQQISHLPGEPSSLMTLIPWRNYCQICTPVGIATHWIVSKASRDAQFAEVLVDAII